MIEVTLYDYLSTTLENALVVMEQPETAELSEFMVVIQKTGSSTTNKICTSTFAIQSYGSSLYDAASLNATVKEAMESFDAETDVIGCRLVSDYNFTDTETKRYRYQAVFDISHY